MKWVSSSMRPKDVGVPLKLISVETVGLAGLAYLSSMDIKRECINGFNQPKQNRITVIILNLNE
jgi:hypothetical protein